MVEVFNLSRAVLLEAMSLGTEIFPVLLCIIYLFFSSKKHKKQDIVAEYGLGMMVMLVFPGVLFLLRKLLNIPDIVDSYMIVPGAVMIAYTGTILIHREHHAKERAAVIASVVVILLAGSSIPWNLTFDNFSVIKNSMKLSDSTYAVTDMIGSEYILVPQELGAQMQEYDSGTNILWMQSGLEEEDAAAIFDYAVTNNCVFVALNQKEAQTVDEENCSFIFYGEAGKYVIYQKVPEEAGQV